MSSRHEQRVSASARAEGKADEIRAEIMAEASFLGIEVRESTIPPRPRRGSKFEGMCGCEEAVDLELTLIELERLNAARKPAPYCNQCRATMPRLEFEKRVREMGGNTIRGLTSFEHTVELHCGNPLHPPFEAWPGNVLYRDSWCPQCRYEDRKDAVEVRLAEAAASMGVRLDSYIDAKTPATFIRQDGTAFDARASNLAKSIPLTRNTVSVAMKGKRAFVYAGDLPEGVPMEIEQHMDGAEVFMLGDGEVMARKAHAIAAMERMIRWLAKDEKLPAMPAPEGFPDVERPLEVLNVWKNPQWQRPGVFTWGTVEPYFAPNLDAKDVKQTEHEDV